MQWTSERLAVGIQKAQAAADRARGEGKPGRARRHEQRRKILEGCLLTREEPTVRRMARRFHYLAHRAGMEEQDLFQIGYIKLKSAILRFDPRRGRLTPFISVVLSHHFTSLVRKRYPEPCGALDKALDQNPTHSADRLWETAWVQEVLARLYEGDLQQSLKTLAFRRYFLEEGWTLHDLARDFHVGISTVHKWLRQGQTAYEIRYGGLPAEGGSE